MIGRRGNTCDGRSLSVEGVCTPAQLEGAALSSQEVIHLLFPFRFEEEIEEDGNHSQEAGHRHHSYHQPCKCGICQERGGGKYTVFFLNQTIIVSIHPISL